MSNYFKHKMRGKSPVAIVAMVIFGGAAITGLAILFGFIIMWLWNWLMPDLFGLSTITYWQAAGLFILSKILLGGIGGGSGSKSSSKRSKSKCSSECGGDKNGKTDFSKWKHYDKFWEEEGNKAYGEYVESIGAGKSDESTEE